MKDKHQPEGMKAFLKHLEENTREKMTDNANIDCMECGRKIFLVGNTYVSMHVFVFPDKPFYTTKGVCFNCLNELVREHGGKQIGEQLN